MLLPILFLIILNIKFSFENGNSSVVFESGEGGYFCVRIPSILTTAKGSLLAFGEGRMYNCDDNTPHDLIYKRSIDNGQTWSYYAIVFR